MKSMNLAQREQMAEISNDPMCWDDLALGIRRRWWCKFCRDEGKPWLTPWSCTHIRRARVERKISRGELKATLRHLKAR